MIMLATMIAMLVALQEPSVAECGLISGADTLLDEADGRLVLLGELHGTQQAPAFTASLICQGVARGDHTILGLEMSATEQDRLEAYLSSDGSETAIAALTAGSWFWESSRDGRSSIAMLSLIDAVRRHRAAGASIDLVAVDFDPVADADLDDTPHIRDQAMLRRARRFIGDADNILILVGNVHARRTPFVYGDLHLETIGSLANPDEVYSLRLGVLGGEAWSCRRADGVTECGPHASAGYVDLGEHRVMSLDEAIEAGVLGIEADAYHRYVFLGESDVSRPLLAPTD
jgi:hypothetical protein